jgi:hypothetical protein
MEITLNPEQAKQLQSDYNRLVEICQRIINTRDASERDEALYEMTLFFKPPDLGVRVGDKIDTKVIFGG